MSFNPHKWYLYGKRSKYNYIITLSTTSTSATWSPQLITNIGDTLTWDISGDIAPASYNVDDPTIDLSANTGTVNMVVYNVNGLTQLICFSNQLTSLDVTNNTALTLLYCHSNQITSLDVSNNTALTRLYCYDNGMSSTIVDKIFIDLDNNGVSNGLLAIGNNRTSASNTARANLISKGWRIQDFYTP